MKYLVVKHSSSLIKVSDDLNSAIGIKSSGINKDWGWFIEEDGTAIYEGVEYEVKKGDYVMTAYTPNVDDYKLIIIRNADLYQNYLDFKEADRKRKEERASEISCCESCDKCSKRDAFN